MKNSKLVLTLLIIISVIGMLTAIVHGSQNNNQQTIPNPSSSTIPAQTHQTILFYGATCPHCQEVEVWMEKNGVGENVVVKKEVYNNQDNAQELAQAAASCGFSTDRIGVPFLYANQSTCLVGTSEIINYLSATPAAQTK